MPELYTKRLWGGDAMNCGDWKMYLAFDFFIAEEDIEIVGFDFSGGICGLLNGGADGEYHGYAELSLNPEWGKPNRLAMIGIAMVVKDGKPILEYFDHIAIMFTPGTYVPLRKDDTLYLHFQQTAPLLGNSISGFDATIYYRI